MTYEKAYQQLQEILHQLKNEEVSIDQMKKHVTKARKLIITCREKLREIEADLLEEE